MPAERIWRQKLSERNPDTRRRNEPSPDAEDEDRTSGQKTPGSEVIMTERWIIRCSPDAATENQRYSERKGRAPGAVRAQRAQRPMSGCARARYIK